MYLGFYNFYRSYNNNRMFTDPSSPIGDDLAYPTVFLGRYLTSLGHRVATIDTDDLSRFDAVVFLDHPTPLNRYYRQLTRPSDHRAKLYLVLLENPANRPDNYWRSLHQPFERVFTYCSDWADGRKYIQFMLPNRLPLPVRLSTAEKKRFCVTIASQKYNAHPKELYSERVRAIRWFEREHPEEFDLYGTQWDRWWFKGALSRLNLFLGVFYRKFPAWGRRADFPSHRGVVPRKHEVLKQYRFSLCYENAVFPGYITEKPFDCWLAGCVPVYLGAPDIDRHVPPGTYIDRRQFKDHADLYRYLKSMSASEYEGYLAAIETFLNGPAARPFSAEGFAELMVRHVVTAGGRP
jgi:hypothetical protein